MGINEISNLELTINEIVQFYVYSLKDRDTANALSEVHQEEYSNIIIDVRSHFFNINEINSVDFKDKFYTETEEEYLELELINTDKTKIYTYNDVAGFIIRDRILYTLFHISDNELVKFILVIHIGISQYDIEELAQFCMMKRFKNVTVYDYKGGIY